MFRELGWPPGSATPEFAEDVEPLPLTEPLIMRIRQLAEGGDPTLPQGVASPLTSPWLEVSSDGCQPPSPGRGYPPGEAVYELTS